MDIIEMATSPTEPTILDMLEQGIRQAWKEKLLYCCSPEEIKPRPSREQLDVIKDAFEVRKAKEVLARQSSQTRRYQSKGD